MAAGGEVPRDRRWRQRVFFVSSALRLARRVVSMPGRQERTTCPRGTTFEIVKPSAFSAEYRPTPAGISDTVSPLTSALPQSNVSNRRHPANGVPRSRVSAMSLSRNRNDDRNGFSPRRWILTPSQPLRRDRGRGSRVRQGRVGGGKIVLSQGGGTLFCSRGYDVMGGYVRASAGLRSPDWGLPFGGDDCPGGRIRECVGV